MKSCLIEIKIGNSVIYKTTTGEDIIVNIEDIVLTPNGINDPKLITLIYATTAEGGIVSATSDKFRPTDEDEYAEFFPSAHHCNISTKVEKRRYHITVFNKETKEMILDEYRKDPVGANTLYDNCWRRYIADKYRVNLKKE